MSDILITAGPFQFEARFEEALAPRTVARFKALLPYAEKVIHVRWSGEAVWIPLGDTDLGLPTENQTSYPAPGQIIVYPGGKSETDPAGLWRRQLLQQGRATGGQPLPDDHVAPRRPFQAR